ncbi:MAG: hypothetical protein ABWK05_04495 [Pyrobaculum sp.]
MELPKGARYEVYQTRRYKIYYLLDDVKLEGAEKRFVKGGHEFLYFGDVVVIRPIRTSQVEKAL